MTPERSAHMVRSVLFTGVDAKQRSAPLSAAAAEILSGRVVGSVCVIDANLRTPSLHRHYGVSNDVGMVQALSGTAAIRDYATRLGQRYDKSLWFLAAGSSSVTGASILTTGPGRSRLQELLRAFDYIIIDAPPVSQDPLTVLLGAQIDGAVLVVGADVTKRHDAETAADTLRSSGVRVLGAVFRN